MSAELTDLQLLHELEPVVEKYMNRHLSMHKNWNPHDYIPWSDGKNFYALGGQDWEPGAEPALRRRPGGDGAEPDDRGQPAVVSPRDRDELRHGRRLGQWVNRWTAEENRHGIALRDYLVVTRAVDPVELEKLRLEVVNRGFSPGQNHQGEPVRREPVRLGHLRHVPGAGHPHFAPQHRQGLQRADRRPVAGQDLGRREPAHDLLPRRQRGRRSSSRPTRR